MNAATLPSLAGISMSTASVTSNFLSVWLEHCRAWRSHDALPVHDAADTPATATVAATWGTMTAGKGQPRTPSIRRREA